MNLKDFGKLFLILFVIVLSACGNQKQDYDISYKPKWKAKFDLKSTKAINEYDAIVVGSGIGGLTSASLLAKEGFKVLVLEQSHQIGGFSSSYGRDEFTFGTGGEDVSGLWERGSVTYLLKQLNLRKDDLFVKHTREYILNGEKLVLPNDYEGFVKYLYARFPSESENIKLFFAQAKAAYEEINDPLVFEFYGIRLDKEQLVELFGKEKMQSLSSGQNISKWMNKNYQQKLDEFFKDENLKAFLKSLLGYLGLEADKTPALTALLANLSYFIFGGYYPKGGPGGFALALKKLIESHGGVVLADHKVDKVLIKDKTVEGVCVGDKIFKSSIVIANANAKTLFLNLVDSKEFSDKFILDIKNLKMSTSAFVVHLGLDMDLSKIPASLVVSLDNGLYMLISTNVDKSLAPANKSVVTLIKLIDYKDFHSSKSPEYTELKEKTANQLIAKAETIIPNLSKKILVRDISTPYTFERYTSMPEGAIYAFDRSKNKNVPYFKSPIEGLYLASASAKAGGIEAVVIAGIWCKHDILNWKR
ncbi:TPA: all-trans-retinol 13,14-reductase [Candidatus Dependentiae bacterium]|nr:MAG: All-trans-retinol 13,14-reductase [candidate division TM6 bacterium GW2011_GWE2_31_21]KKP53150.1 MAG: All-trans-retinol 13,14-reductase [candidate division TM6 bacterium GW2011_GWF2_33_332]HBS47969.1 all-trans-retinol 13,14-reductase [Candidatus Dependentiae bacterium]HBZ73427.1 all-trans-retinol 13,14-reductase [Candidatus Dependentiae bacterium]